MAAPKGTLSWSARALSFHVLEIRKGRQKTCMAEEGPPNQTEDRNA